MSVRERERESSCCRDRIADAAAGSESSGRIVTKKTRL